MRRVEEGIFDIVRITRSHSPLASNELPTEKKVGMETGKCPFCRSVAARGGGGDGISRDC